MIWYGDTNNYDDWGNTKRGSMVYEQFDELKVLGPDGEPLYRVPQPLGFKLGKHK